MPKLKNICSDLCRICDTLYLYLELSRLKDSAQLLSLTGAISWSESQHVRAPETMKSQFPIRWH